MNPLKTLENVFIQLPQKTLGDKILKPSFHYGDIDYLQKVIMNKDVYPIVYLLTPLETSGTREKNSDLKLIIAASTEKFDIDNKVINDKFFDGLLIPIKDDIIYALKTSLATRLQSLEDKKEKMFFNYGVRTNSELEKIAVWHALTLEIGITFTNHCTIKQNIF